MGLKVVDLYCGAGGFSEGFRQLGFDIVAAFDTWEDARTTFKRNHPGAHVPEDHVDISRHQKRTIDRIKERFGHVEVVVGGPPCVEFSSSKNGGKGDIDEGLRHVKAFFNIVRELEPDYWAMENVPRIEAFLDKGIKEGGLKPPPDMRTWNFDSQFHEVPQKRKRRFAGGFPGDLVFGWEKERKGEDEPIPMGVVINGLPKCDEEPSDNIVKDPLYPILRIKEGNLTDHFGYWEFLRLTNWELRKNKDLKLHGGYYGQMNFPEPLDVPARTVMALHFSVSRESMIIKDGLKKGTYRRPSPRECASLQGFPLNYQFWANSIGAKYKLIGNAVPVGVARDIAKAILIDKGLTVPKRRVVGRRGFVPSSQPEISKKRPHRLQGPFHWHPIGSLVHGCRVELDNTQRYVKSGPPSFVTRGAQHICRWDPVLHVGIGRPRWDYELVDPRSILGALQLADMDRMKKDLLISEVRSLHGTIPDATSLSHAHRTPRTWKLSRDGVIRPRALLDVVDRIQSKIVRSKNELVDCKEQIKICPKNGLPLITLVSAFILYWMCREINDCTHWMVRNKEKRYIPQEWEGRGLRVKARCGGVEAKDFPGPF